MAATVNGLDARRDTVSVSRQECPALTSASAMTAATTTPLSHKIIFKEERSPAMASDLLDAYSLLSHLKL
jgi:hypothetical protein